MDGTYYYPDSYEGGRHLPKGKGDSKNKDSEESTKNEFKFIEFSKNDPDFDDKNFSEETRLGDTDFFVFKGTNGNYVIIEKI